MAPSICAMEFSLVQSMLKLGYSQHNCTTGISKYLVKFFVTLKCSIRYAPTFANEGKKNQAFHYRRDHFRHSSKPWFLRADAQ